MKGLFSHSPKPKDGWYEDSSIEIGPCYICGEKVFAHKWSRNDKEAGWTRSKSIPMPNHPNEYLVVDEVRVHFRHFMKDHPNYDGQL